MIELAIALLKHSVFCLFNAGCFNLDRISGSTQTTGISDKPLPVLDALGIEVLLRRRFEFEFAVRRVAPNRRC